MSKRSDGAAWAHPAAVDGALQAFIRLFLGVVVAALATQILLGRIGPLEAILLGGVLAVSAGFGLLMGLLAAAIALITCHSALGASLRASDLSSAQTLLLAVLGVTVAAVGLNADAARRRHRQTHSLLDAGRPLSPHASAGGAERFFRVARRRDNGLGRVPPRIDPRRALASFAIAVAGMAGAVALHGWLGPTGTVLAALAGVLIVAERAGARFGLAAGALTASSLPWVLPAPARGSVAGVQEAVEIILFSAIGWGVGALADAFRHERDARRTLTGAGRDLSAGADEAAVRRILLDSLMRIDPAGWFEVRDDRGGLLSSEATQLAAMDDDGWRSRRLEADGRDVGDVRWRFPDATRKPTSDEIAVSLIDLGASAIVRTRLSAERAEMEYITRAEHLRTILLDAISHHFRSPLAGILGSVTSILNLPEPQDRKVTQQFLLIIKEQANRLNRYVDNFLSLARLEAGAIEPNWAEVNLEVLIYDVWDSFGAVGGARRYLQADLDVEVVRSDAALLTQVFGNILENAIKYSSEESLVEVRTWSCGDRLMIEVLDQGSGVPEASLPRMFDRFYRSQAATAPGLGLGLYITRSLVTILGGEVSARNRNDGQAGLAVSIDLPLVKGVP